VCTFRVFAVVEFVHVVVVIRESGLTIIELELELYSMDGFSKENRCHGHD